MLGANVNREEVREQKRMGATMLALAWIVLLALGLFFFTDLLGRQQNPNQTVEARYREDGVREIVLQRNKFGHYVTSGKINGQAVTFMLDTGATGVAIPADMARRLKLQRGRAIPTQTANGAFHQLRCCAGQRERGAYRVAQALPQVSHPDCSRKRPCWACRSSSISSLRSREIH